MSHKDYPIIFLALWFLRHFYLQTLKFGSQYQNHSFRLQSPQISRQIIFHVPLDPQFMDRRIPVLLYFELFLDPNHHLKFFVDSLIFWHQVGKSRMVNLDFYLKIGWISLHIMFFRLVRDQSYFLTFLRKACASVSYICKLRGSWDDHLAKYI
jgi:hypothetical protein